MCGREVCVFGALDGVMYFFMRVAWTVSEIPGGLFVEGIDILLHGLYLNTITDAGQAHGENIK
jgi:hypothetical protein